MLLTEKHSPPQLKALGQACWEAVLPAQGTTVTRGGLGLALASRWDESALSLGPGAPVGAGWGGPPAEPSSFRALSSFPRSFRKSRPRASCLGLCFQGNQPQAPAGFPDSLWS